MAAWSTYRVQLHAGFGFGAAARVADYLAELGSSHLYCSPYLQAVAGSTHGYDVVDPTRFNSELGGAEGHAELVGALRAAGLGQVLDIVPNHMAASEANPWWWDVLENGPASRYAGFFDIDWAGRDERSAFTVLVPVLANHYGRVLDAGQLVVERRGARFLVCYEEHSLPLSPRTLDGILAGAARRAGCGELAALAEGFGGLAPARTADAAAAAAAERHRLTGVLATALERLVAERPVAAALDAELRSLNDDPDRLDALLLRQNYRLAYWRTANDELDYRRFFNIESLVGVRIDEPAVFNATHSLILALVREGTVEGLRVDHIDGLRDPEGYLTRLATETNGISVIVEKILAADELPPVTWPIEGTTGYDFLFRVNNLFVARHNEAPMTDAYSSLTGEEADYQSVVHAAKLRILHEELAAEVERLTALLVEICERYRRHRDRARRELRDALRELAAQFRVYRTYVKPGRPASPADRQRVAQALRRALEARPDLDPELVGFLAELAVLEHAGEPETEFAERFQQLTGPVMAKGVEDTAFYRYHRLVSLNEVGGDPAVFGRPAEDFHRDTAAVAAHWPNAMLTLSTHDTKRGADVRARLNVLSELPEEWRAAVECWQRGNARYRLGDQPDRNIEYLLYQTLVGSWPIGVERVAAFMAKASKEAKTHTTWLDPAPDYDAALEGFVRAVLADRAFVERLERFLAVNGIVERGRRNALAQTALLLTCPGVADLYQGSELWDLSLVDPDNRRPVDYERRRRLLRELRDGGAHTATADAESGAPKLWLVHRVLRHRRTHGGLYASADYEPLAFAGSRAEDAIGFHRGRLAVVVPRFGSDAWGATTVELPGKRWTDVVTGASRAGGEQALATLFESFPVAVLAAGGS